MVVVGVGCGDGIVPGSDRDEETAVTFGECCGESDRADDSTKGAAGAAVKVDLLLSSSEPVDDRDESSNKDV
jgi:hypothetical protein